MESKALLSDAYTNLDAEFIEPPEKLLPALNAKVNFSFKGTKLSQVLLMLSKVGEFNIVMPNKYDKESKTSVSWLKSVMNLREVL